MTNLILRFHIWIYALAWPNYECERCIGQDYGCQCSYYGAPAPGISPERWRVWLRRVIKL